MKRVGVCFFVLVVAVTISSFAQETDTHGTIIYAQGQSFTLSRDNESTDYDLYYDDVIGLPLQQGDYISTDSGTFLEIQLSTSGNVLKVSENTNLELSSVEKRGGGSVELTYGRVRAKIGKLFGEEQFRVRGPTVVAGVRGTDFGYDIIAGDESRTDEQMARVYCFEGKIEVNRIKDGEVLETVTIEEGQMALHPVKEPDTPIETTGITPEVREFWDANPFEGEPRQPAPEPEEAEEEPEPEPEAQKEQPREEARVEKVFTAKDKKTLKIGTGLMASGLVLEGAGLLTYFIGEQFHTGSTETFLKNVGFSLVAPGLLFVTGGVISFFAVLWGK
jgi:hypothetical protein